MKSVIKGPIYGAYATRQISVLFCGMIFVVKKVLKKSNSILLRSVTPSVVVGLFFLLCIAIAAGIGMRLIFSHEASVHIHPVVTAGKQQSLEGSRGVRPGEESDPKTHPQQYDLVAVEKALGAKQKVQFPSVQSESLVKVVALPKLFQSLMLQGAADTTAVLVVYDNAQKGYKISYTLPSTMNYDQISRALRGALGSDKAAGEWNEVYGFLERVDASASVRVVWRRPEPGVYTIVVQSMNQ